MRHGARQQKQYVSHTSHGSRAIYQGKTCGYHTKFAMIYCASSMVDKDNATLALL